MSSTFLSLTNKVLGRVNEVALTSATFAAATGFHSQAKQFVLDSIRKINQDQREWPFNHTSTTQLLVADQATYSLPSDYKIVDWETFFLQPDTSLDAPARPLALMNYDEWFRRRKTSDDSLDTGDGGVPEVVYRTRDDKFGLSTIPDAAYTVEYEYWATPVDLTLHSSTTNIPSAYDHIIVEGAMWHVYMFRSNYESASMSKKEFDKGLIHMRSLLIERDTYVWDRRTNRELSRSSGTIAASRPN